MLIVGCRKGEVIAKKVARLLKAEYSSLQADKFPDNELHVRYNTNVKGKDVVLVQSFFGDVNDLLMEVVFAAYTAKDLKAKSVRLVATYFPYFRQDKRFKEGECISIEVVGKMLDKCLDEFIVVNPHLHRKKSLREIFKTKTKLLTTIDMIYDYLDKRARGDVIIGPDRESKQWIARLAKRLGSRFIILDKKRFNADKVAINSGKLRNLKGKNIVVVDDMVSTGHTLLEVAKHLKRAGANNILFVCTHGLFYNDSVNKIREYGKIVASNTVENKAAVLDVSKLIADNLR